jgi:hypothetical protein
MTHYSRKRHFGRECVYYKYTKANEPYRANDEIPATEAKKTEPKASTVGESAAVSSRKPVEEEQGPPKYAKEILKKGDKVNFPKKNDIVSVW